MMLMLIPIPNQKLQAKRLILLVIFQQQIYEKLLTINFMTLIVAFCRMLEPREPRVLKSQFKTKWLHASLTVKYTFLFKT